MKIQNGFISSSSSSSLVYSTTVNKKVTGYTEGYEKLLTSNSNSWVNSKYNTYSALNLSSNDQNVVWTTYKSSSYQRIEYFMQAIEKLNTAYSKNNVSKYPMYNYSKNVAARNLYDGFVDIVITFPCRIRLAGIELLNPWNNKLSNDKEYNYWKYLPREFNIYKVNDNQTNDLNENVTYENDVAKMTLSNEERILRPVYYDSLESDDNLTFLGAYSVNWENISNYKCFFKFNFNDKVSVASQNSETELGTATWECKQLVIRIFKAYENTGSLKYYPNEYSKGILHNICQYILDKELEYGTTHYDNPITIEVVEQFYDKYLKLGTNSNFKKISKATNDMQDNPFRELGIMFGSSVVRSYDKVNDMFFTAGIEYKLGGIQLLLSPDIFSVSEMKMYNYSNTTNNKVFIGEWNSKDNVLIYYGTGTTKRSDLIDVSSPYASTITWKHNFNVPPKYLEVKVYAQFTVDYGSFYAGDVITNLVNADREPITMRLTGTDVTLNVSNGVCFTNPETGTFMVFKDGKGIQMDTEGNYDAYNAAVAVGANVITTQSLVTTKIEADDPTKGDAYPFKIYFVVKRLF